MIFFKFIFYFFWLIYACRQIFIVYSIRRHSLKMQALINAANTIAADKTKKLDRSLYGTVVDKFGFGIGGLILKFIGLLSANWFIFLPWIITDFLFAPVMKFARERSFNTYVVLNFFFELLEFLLTIFVILNAFHFHISAVEAYDYLITKF